MFQAQANRLFRSHFTGLAANFQEVSFAGRHQMQVLNLVRKINLVNDKRLRTDKIVFGVLADVFYFGLKRQVQHIQPRRHDELADGFFVVM